jgi:hypothetical protein
MFEDTQPDVFHGDRPDPPDVCLIEVSEVLQAPSHLTAAPSAALRLERGRDWAHRHAISVLLSCSASAVGLLCWATAQLQTPAAARIALSAAGGPSAVLVAAQAQQPPRGR